MSRHRRRPPRPIGPATVLGVTVLGIVTALAVRTVRNPENPPTLAPLPNGTEAVRGRIESVTDGDTVVVDFGSAGTERVRLLGIDTPETVKPGSPVECWGPEASARAEELLPPGTAILAQRDEEARDRYGRLLLYLWRAEDGLFINRLLLEEGHAVTLAIAPNNTYRSTFSATQATARAAERGLWGHCDEPP